jgi:hypothetical protein
MFRLNRNKQKANRNSLIGSIFCYFLQQESSLGMCVVCVVFSKWQLLHIIRIEFNVDKKIDQCLKLQILTFLCIVVFMSFLS